MKRHSNPLEGLSKAQWFVLVGSVIAIFAIFFPWHTMGTAVLGTSHSFNGFGDQNMIIGIITFAFMFASLSLILLPQLGIKLPKSGWKESGMLIFFGGEASLLLLVLTIMHATSLTRAANYDLRIGIHLALIGAALVFFGGYLLKGEEHHSAKSHAEPLAHLPRRHPANHLDLREDATDKEKEDSRMQLDI
jgi:hypothetical protein